MAKRKGIIQEAQEKLSKVESQIAENYEKARELQQEAYKLRINSPNDFKAMEKADELDKLASSHIAMAERLASTEKYIAVRDLKEKQENAQRIKGNIDHFRAIKENAEKEKEQLEKQHRDKLEQLDGDIESFSWEMEQAQLVLEEMEGK